MPHAKKKTSGKLINTTFIIGDNFQTKKGSLTVPSVPHYCPLYHVTPSLTFRTPWNACKQQQHLEFLAPSGPRYGSE